MDNTDVFLEVIARLRNLRWKWSTVPGPIVTAPSESTFIDMLRRSLISLEPSLGALQKGIVRRCLEIIDYVESNPISPITEVLIESLQDGQEESLCVVIANTQCIPDSKAWLQSQGYRGMAVPRSDMSGTPPQDQLILIGTPNLFGPGAYTAPRSSRQMYIYPAWVPVKALPESRLGRWMDAPIVRERKVFPVGSVTPARGSSDLEQGLPELEPVWTEVDNRAPRPEEVLARKVMLAGGYSMMLDIDGARIRAFDPDADPDDRIQQLDVAEVRPGTVLVLRQGTTDSGALLEATRRTLGPRSDHIMAAQKMWKDLLERKIGLHGSEWVDRNLRRLGMRVYPRSEDWIRLEVSGPRSDADFSLLLTWLDLKPQEYIKAAHEFRAARSLAIVDIRRDLENSFSKVELEAFKRQGYLSLESDKGHFARMLAARVLAIAPHTEPVHRQTVRIVRKDRNALWLE